MDEKGESFWDFYVTAQIFADGEPLCLPEQTSHRNLMGKPTWNEWLSLPVTVDALPLSSVCVFNVWDCSSEGKAIPVGGTSIPIFSEKYKMLKGRKKLFLWMGKEGDGAHNNSSTPYDAAELDETDRLDKCLLNYQKQKYDRIGWLDALSFTEIRLKQEMVSKSRKKGVAFLHIEFPVFQCSVIFHQKEFVIDVDESSTNEIVKVFDPEISQNNPVDDKFQRMLRMQIGMQANVKPTTMEKKMLSRIVAYPPTKVMSESDKNKIWMFRFYLKGVVDGLPKFLLSVDWLVDDHAKEAVKLMHQWATLSIEVALELLSDQFAVNERIREQYVFAIREHAVQFLDTMDDADLSMFLLQLVQAMRPERLFLQKPLSDFLIERAKRSKTFGTRFFWYLKVESETENDDGIWYKGITVDFMNAIKESDEALYKMYRRQEVLVKTLKELYKFVTETSKNRMEMIDVLRREISVGKFNQLKSFEPLPLPLNPELEVKGLIPDKCSVFKSAQKPFGLCFEKCDGSPYMVLFKVGDDLRCDQLVLQIISLMDGILKRDGNLDMCLSPYRCMATGRSDGMIEIVPDSISVAACLKANDNDIASYFRKINPKENGPFGIDAKVLDNFVRSCAGYCVITFLLGVGDRHLDNLLICKNGKLFHIDFGFILGEDPKSWPPPMKITREMVMAMGGDASETYYQFRNLCCECYTLLRRRSNLVITLFNLMLRAGIENGHKIFNNKNDLFKIQDKYLVDETEEVAIETIQVLLQKSVAALMPRLFEDFHSWAQYWRS